MSKTVKILIIVLSSIVGLLGLCYIGLAYYYSHANYVVDDVVVNGKCFTYGTYVNSVYATGMTAEQVENELNKKYSDITSVNFKIDDKSYELALEDIGYSHNYGEILKNALDSQNSLLWGVNFLETQQISVDPEIVIDEKLFDERFNELKLEKDINNSGELYIYFDDEEGYLLYDGKTSAYNIEKIRKYIIEKLLSGETEIEIGDDCKNDIRYSDHDKYLLEYYEILSNKTNKDLSYRFGTENQPMKGKGWATLYNTEDVIEKITPAMVKSEICVDGIDFELDKERVLEFLTCYLDEYNTYNNRHFITHDGSEVYVKAGNYGNQLDLTAEADWLLDYVNNNNTVLYRTPEYKIKANFPEKNDFGDTFIEIDLDCQRMWYYVDGKTYVDTNVVTGSYYNGTSCTSPRVVSVYTIIPNKWLNGPTWHCFVKYWVAIQGAIGIHDASWRTDWTDDAYCTGAGSHGCINTPETEMKKIFEHVQIGTPVIVYSHKVNAVNDEE